ncbi:DUF4231 domain-containing protein [Streptomyces graminilatus]|uniref:DUF4231 domain-containing protein n=1 Tax=Streptomyces graminilatus TaxID=1464070 RepID=UPI0012FED4BF|nr:DUF4231 domain-containing protein [Streptomyces graminilatus]
MTSNSGSSTGVLAGRQQLSRLRKSVRQKEQVLTWKRKRARLRLAATVLGASALAIWVVWTALHWGDRAVLVRGSWVCAPSLGAAVLVLITMTIQHTVMKEATDNVQSMFYPVPSPERYTDSMAKVKDELEDLQEEIRLVTVTPSLLERRNLYREEMPDVIEQYRSESRRYRRVHNSLQALIMVGSTAVTTLAAMEAKDWTWQTILMIGLGFCVTIATAFTGYYKYRERSYFLQQTADAIEEEVNGFMLGVGPYTEQPADQAMALFTQRVESLRNEQRRRQQQLDQPADQAQEHSQPVS